MPTEANVQLQNEYIRKMISSLLVVGDRKLTALKDEPIKSPITGIPYSEHDTINSQIQIPKNLVTH